MNSCICVFTDHVHLFLYFNFYFRANVVSFNISANLKSPFEGSNQHYANRRTTEATAPRGIARELQYTCAVKVNYSILFDLSFSLHKVRNMADEAEVLNSPVSPIIDVKGPWGRGWLPR